jgi:hypothetical protein
MGAHNAASHLSEESQKHHASLRKSMLFSHSCISTFMAICLAEWGAQIPMANNVTAKQGYVPAIAIHDR